MTTATKPLPAVTHAARSDRDDIARPLGATFTGFTVPTRLVAGFGDDYAARAHSSAWRSTTSSPAEP